MLAYTCGRGSVVTSLTKRITLEIIMWRFLISSRVL